MIMEYLVDSGNDSEIRGLDSITACSNSSSRFTEPECESNEEIAVDQLPQKLIKTRGGLAFWPTKNPTAAASVTP